MPANPAPTITTSRSRSSVMSIPLSAIPTVPATGAGAAGAALGRGRLPPTSGCRPRPPLGSSASGLAVRPVPLLPLPPFVAPDRRLRAICRPATPWLSAWASASDRPWAPLSTIIWSMSPNGLAAASTIAGHFSASCWPMTASWFSARASARALMASASAMPLARTASPSARPLAWVAAASASPMARVASARAAASSRTCSASAAGLQLDPLGLGAGARASPAGRWPAALSSTSWRWASAAAMRASRSALASVTCS